MYSNVIRTAQEESERLKNKNTWYFRYCCILLLAFHEAHVSLSDFFLQKPYFSVKHFVKCKAI